MLNGIPSERSAINISDVDLERGDNSVQKSLGVIWDPKLDHFWVKVSKSEFAWTNEGDFSLSRVSFLTR